MGTIYNKTFNGIDTEIEIGNEPHLPTLKYEKAGVKYSYQVKTFEPSFPEKTFKGNFAWFKHDLEDNYIDSDIDFFIDPRPEVFNTFYHTTGAQIITDIGDLFQKRLINGLLNTVFQSPDANAFGLDGSLLPDEVPVPEE